jgi:hypothetical protein
MVSFREAFRQGREQARAARGAPPLARNEWNNNAGAAPDPRDDAGVAGGEPQSGSNTAQLDDMLHQRDNELVEAKRLLGEMTDYAETMEARVIELVAQAEPMAKALLLPKVKTGLLKAFHPDKHPKASDEQREELTAAMKIITSAYAAAEKLQPPSDE